MVKKISGGTNFIIAIDNIIKTNQNTVNIHEMPNIIYVNTKFRFSLIHHQNNTFSQ